MVEYETNKAERIHKLLNSYYGAEEEDDDKGSRV